MRTIRLHFLSLATLTLASFSVSAQPISNPWAGPYGQIGLIGYESYIPKSASGTTALSSNGPVVATNSTANHANGPVANVAVGYTFEVQNQFLLGIGAALYPGHSRSANTTAITHGIPTYGTYDVSNVFSFSLIPSYALDANRLAYLKIGYAGSTLNANSPGNYPQQSTRVSGIVYGAGYKQMITESIYGFLEGNYAVNKAKSVSVITDQGYTVSSTLNATGYDFLIGVGYRF